VKTVPGAEVAPVEGADRAVIAVNRLIGAAVLDAANVDGAFGAVVAQRVRWPGRLADPHPAVVGQRTWIVGIALSAISGRFKEAARERVAHAVGALDPIVALEEVVYTARVRVTFVDGAQVSIVAVDGHMNAVAKYL